MERRLLALHIHRLVNDAVHNFARQRALGISKDISLLIDHKGRGIGADAVLIEKQPFFIHYNREGVIVFGQKRAYVLDASFPAQSRTGDT